MIIIILLCSSMFDTFVQTKQGSMASISPENIYMLCWFDLATAEAKRCEQRKSAYPYIYLPTQSPKRDSKETLAPLLALVWQNWRGIMGRGVCIKFLLVCNLELLEQFLNLNEGSTAARVGWCCCCCCCYCWRSGTVRSANDDGENNRTQEMELVEFTFIGKYM